MSVPTQSETRSYGRLLEYTKDHLLPGIVSAAIDSQPAVSIFAGRLANAMFPEQGPSGRGKRVLTGATIEQKIRLGKNTTFGTLTDGYDTFDTTPQDNVRHLRFNWKLYGGTVNISGHEIDTNSSPEAVANMVESEMRDAVESLADELGSHIYTGSSIATRITGLDELINCAAGTATIGGLSRTTYPALNSRGVSADGTAPASIVFTPTTTSFAAAGLANMRTAWNQSSDGNSQPQVILTTMTNHERYEGSLEPQHRFTSMALADAGIRALEFKQAPVIPDRKATSGAMYFLNLDKLFLSVLSGADFASTPFTQPETQRVQVAKVYITCEMVCTDPKRENKLTGITA